MSKLIWEEGHPSILGWVKMRSVFGICRFDFVQFILIMIWLMQYLYHKWWVAFLQLLAKLKYLDHLLSSSDSQVIYLPVLHTRGSVAGLVHHGPHAVLGRLLQVLKAARAPQPPPQGLQGSASTLCPFLPSRGGGHSPLPTRCSLASFSPRPPFVHHARDLWLDCGKSLWTVFPQLMKTSLGPSTFSRTRIIPHNLMTLV